MQPSAVETKLPRAIVRQRAALEDRYGQPKVTKLEPDPVVVATATPDTPAEPSATPPADPRENDPAYWKQRFTVTSGILRTEREDRKVEKASLTQRINELESELQAARDKAPAADLDLGMFFTPEQVDEMGEETARAMVVTIQKQVRTQVDAALKPQRDSAAQAEADRAKDRDTAFTDRLAELVPDYVEIDASDEWKAWLATETADGVERQAVLDRHVTARNADRVAKMFQDFKASQTRPTPPITPNGTAATPTTTAPAGLPAASSAPSPKEITEFYKRAALGKVKPEERARFEERMELLKA